MEKGASQAEALNGAGGKSAHLTVQGFAQLELLRELPDSLGCRSVRKLIQSAKKEKILTAGEPRVKAMVRASVVSQEAANVARLMDCVVSRDACVAPRGHQEGRQNTQERGLAGTVGAKKRPGLAPGDPQ